MIDTNAKDLHDVSQLLRRHSVSKQGDRGPAEGCSDGGDSERRPQQRLPKERAAERLATEELAAEALAAKWRAACVC